MMAKLGFKAGDTLGKRDKKPADDSEPGSGSAQARSEPLNLVFKENRGGIGLDSEKKRKIREEAEEASKKIKHEEGTYRDRVREERELKRTEAQVRAAQKVTERLDTESDKDAQPKDSRKDTENEDTAQTKGSQDEEPEPKEAPKKPKQVKPTAQINVLYRGLIRERENRERETQARHALQTSLPTSFFPNPTLPVYEDGELERDDKKALGMKAGPYTAALEQELEEEDPELEAFDALEPAERLRKLVLYLRETFRYCFWCKYRYTTDEELESCPGLTEEDHD